MAGLTVLLEAQAKGLTSHNNPQILCKAEALRFSQSLPSRRSHQPAPHTPLPATFLELCFLCRRHLSHEEDIYMYRGDRAFCSEECRRRQILMDEDDVGREKKGRSRHRKGTNNKSRVTARGGFAY